ncbi:TonB-dependent receptor [Denitratisoma oestradiolicum]|uniref:Putative TonB-dependent receptor n=1 Tax=Denitratisoma oestradiolicum TaxID=311182 RepID=A0A6S6XZS0_9PROT|nr:TonB-dependent receptor [Denitratisoma oestradiolicum]CAB1370483.1 putative TonB-dependent receptor [Denitratisoma oestradiolicum]
MKKIEHGFTMRTLPLLIAALSGVPSLAYAQGAALEEVIVTAQKRSENLQDVPISVQALNSKALENAGIVSLSDIRAAVPGLTIDTYPGSSEMLYPSIRGIVPNSIQTSVPIPMAIHLDGVALTQLAGLNLAGADLERIEVLKGPQGVLAGRNATGGAINIVTVKPELGRFGFKQQVTVAERGQWLSKTVVNVPLSDNFAAKISYLHSERDHLGVKNSAPGGPKLGEKKTDSWRLDLRWKAANNVMVDYGYDRAQTDSIDLPNQCLVPFGSTSFLPFLATVDPRVSSVINGCSTSKLSSLNVPFNMPKNRNIAEGHNLTVTWDVDPKLTFRSITGYRKVDTKNNVLYTASAGDAYLIRSDGLPISFLGGTTPFDGQSHPWVVFNESWSQEFQLLGDVSDNFKYTTGVYVSSEKGHQAQGPGIFFTVPDALFLSTFNPADIGVDMATLEHRSVTARNSTWALFGQFSWRPDILSRKLEVVPGIRYTRDHRQAVGMNQRGESYFYTATATPGVNNLLFSVPNPLAYANVAGDNSFSKTTPTVSLNYHWNDGLMTYLKVAKGYVTGGFDDQQGTAAGFAKGFDPETITSYELGMKGEFLDRRLRINGAVFQSEYKNEQKTVVHPGNVWAIENVGTSKYNGMELDITAQVSQGFRVSASATWLDHKYAKWMDKDPTSPTFGTDVSRMRKLVVPKVSYSINLDYRFPDLGLPGKLDANLNFAHKDSQSTPIDLSNPVSANFITTPKYDVMNGRLALSQIKVGPGGNGDLTVALWGKNLNDKKYHNFNLTNTSADQVTTWSEPRTYGIDVIYNY